MARPQASKHVARPRVTLRGPLCAGEAFGGDLSQLVGIVVDEISQIGTNNMAHMNVRLQSFFGNKLLFGGLLVIAPGDVRPSPASQTRCERCTSARSPP